MGSTSIPVWPAAAAPSPATSAPAGTRATTRRSTKANALSPWRDDDPTFPGQRGRFLSPGTPRLASIRACGQAAVPRTPAHALRRTGAALLVLASVPLVLVPRRPGYPGIGISADVFSP